MAEPVRRSPLPHREPIRSEGMAALSEAPFLTKLVLRGEAKTLSAGAKSALGAALPANGKLATTAKATILATSPDEWLIIAAEASTKLMSALGKKLAKHHHQIADVTDYYTTIRLTGSKARTMLQKITTRDMHARSFAVGTCGGINLAHAAPVIALVGEDEAGASFEMHIRWSHADYLWCELAHAGLEYGLPHQTPLHGEKLVI